MTEKLQINKVHLDSLINLLVNLYEQGADYIDIVAMKENGKDILQVNMREEYMIEEAREEKPLSEDDINKLIG